MAITTAKELGQAIKDDVDIIEIEGDLASKVIRIKATGKIAWSVAAGALAVVITTMIMDLATLPLDVATLGLSKAFKSFVATAGGATAATTLGTATATAVTIGVAGGGIGALNKLRDYRLEKKNDKKVILYKK